MAILKLVLLSEPLWEFTKELVASIEDDEYLNSDDGEQLRSLLYRLDNAQVIDVKIQVEAQ